MDSKPNLSSTGPRGNDGGTVRDVVACVISDPAGRVLIARRPEGKRHAGLWEFPGGKVHDGETLAEAADRELAEELGVRLQRAADLADFVHDDPGSHFRIIFLRVEVDGRPDALEHAELAWFDPRHDDAPAFAPADAAYARRLAEPTGTG